MRAEHIAVNKAFLIIVIPALATSFGWLAFGWGWRVAVLGTALELLVIVPAVVYLLRRQNRLPDKRQRGSEAVR